jgi:hypothetical protein
MNTNLLHNILNIVSAVIAALSVPEVTALIPPAYAIGILGALSTAKLIVNAARDGVAGMVKPQPPVKQ